jgi:cell division protein FtsL
VSLVSNFRQFIESLAISDKMVEFVRNHRWLIVVLVALASIWFLLLVTNVRSVNKLLVDIRQLEAQSQKLDNINERYLYEIVKLQSAERIIQIAEEQLNMEQSPKAPDILK